jgi:hypothetical protein
MASVTKFDLTSDQMAVRGSVRDGSQYQTFGGDSQWQ